MKVSPREAFAVEAVFWSVRSAFCTGQTTGVVTPEVLFPVFGSFVLETVAELRILVEQKDGLFWSCTTMERVVEELALSVPMLQLTCCPVIVQLGAARIVREEGIVSVITAFCAAVVVEGFVSARL